MEFVVGTDGFVCDDIEADDIDDAIRQAFDGEGMAIKDEQSLRKQFAKYIDDGGWCWIERNGERVLEIGDCP